jgi:hypothetical protein
MWESVGKFLEWVDQYGADKVFMVAMFILYTLSQKRVAKVQDARLDDNKKAVEALIEARHAIEEAHDITEVVSDEVRQNRADNKEEFGKVKGRLDRVDLKLETINETIKAN